MGRILDDKDRELISLLEEDPDLSQREIADNLGLSQPSVGMRLKKLKENGAISFHVGVDLRKSGLYLAKVEITTKDPSKQNFAKNPRSPLRQAHGTVRDFRKTRRAINNATL